MSSSREKLEGDFLEHRIQQVSYNEKPELISKVNVLELFKFEPRSLRVNKHEQLRRERWGPISRRFLAHFLISRRVHDFLDHDRFYVCGTIVYMIYKKIKLV